MRALTAQTAARYQTLDSVGKQRQTTHRFSSSPSSTFFSEAANHLSGTFSNEATGVQRFTKRQKLRQDLHDLQKTKKYLELVVQRA